MRTSVGSVCLWSLIAMCFLGVPEAAVAAESIAPGENIRLDFVCRLSSGEIAATTYRELSDNPGIPRAAIFRKRTGDQALVIAAGQSEAVYGKASRRGFEAEIVARITESVVGMELGQVRSIELAGEIQPGLPQGERYLEMARVRSCPKLMRMSADAYRANTKREPMAGRSYVDDPAFIRTVSTVEGGEVTIACHAEAGTTVETPLGKGTIRDAGSHWELGIDAKVGNLVRTGPLVGRIAGVEDRLIIIDYGHPFGGEVLQCDVRATRPEEEPK